MLTRIILFALVAAVVACSLQMFRTLREKPPVDESVSLLVENKAKGATRDRVDEIFNARLATTSALRRQAIDPPSSYCEVLASDLEALERLQWRITSPGRFDVFLVDENSSAEEYRKEQIVSPKPEVRVVWPADKPKTVENAIVVKTDPSHSVQDLRFDAVSASADLYGAPALRATLSPSDARLMNELTSQNLHKQVVIAIDGVAIVVATIQSPLGAEVLITGTDALPVSLDDLVAVARSGPYPVGAELQAELIRR